MIPRELNAQLIRPDPSLFGEQVIAFSTTRGLGNMAMVEENNELKINSHVMRLISGLGLKVDKLIQMRPSHQNHCVLINRNFLKSEKKRRYFLVEADSLVTKEKRVALILASGDCLPLYIYDVEQQLIALVHVSRQSLKERIIDNTLWEMLREGGKIKDMKFYIGPGIQSCCYQFCKDEAKLYFPPEILKNYRVARQKFNKYSIHLLEWILWQIKEFFHHCRQIFYFSATILCTCCSQDKNGKYLFYSHRRSQLSKGEDKEEGRNLSFFMLQ